MHVQATRALMRAVTLVVLLETGLVALAATADASPLQLSPPAAERPPGAPAAPPARSPAPGSSGEGAGVVPVPAVFRDLSARISLAQRRLNMTLSREMRQIRETGSLAAMLTVSLVSFVYGVLHAVGPGHGKLVVSAFFLGREARIVKGVIMGGLVSVLQTVSAIAIVLVLVFILGRGGFDVVQHPAWVEVASYGLIVLIGLYLIYSAVTGRHLGHHHAGPAHDDRHVHRGVVLASGLTPCASAIIIMLFALANGVLAVGIAAALVMALGMSVTVSLVGISTIAARKTLLGVMAARPRVALWLRRGLTLTGALLITAVGSLFFANAWSRLH